MATDYFPVLVLMLLAGLVAAALPLLSALLGPRRPDPVKDEVYECGVPVTDSGHKRTYIRYYLTALLFIVFDVEIAFLYPWAVALKRVEFKTFLFAEMMVFLALIFLAYVWDWRKGALEWD